MSDKKEIIISSPKVRKLAREFGANIYEIKGSQREGRVSEDDVKYFITKHKATRTAIQKIFSNR